MHNNAFLGYVWVILLITASVSASLCLGEWGKTDPLNDIAQFGPKENIDLVTLLKIFHLHRRRNKSCLKSRSKMLILQFRYHTFIVNLAYMRFRSYFTTYNHVDYIYCIYETTAHGESNGSTISIFSLSRCPRIWINHDKHFLQISKFHCHCCDSFEFHTELTRVE